MALTDAQLVATRRYLGYPLAGTTMQITENQDVVYMRFGMVTMSLHKRLTSLSAAEESVLINTYLLNLDTLENDIIDARENLDTDVAAVWKRNRNEIDDRASLFADWRRRLCAFIGIAPGPGISGGISSSIVRA